MAPVRAAPTLTKSKPAYPLLAKKLQELLKGPSIEICVGSHPYLDHLFAVPKALLCYFSVTLRRQFASKVVNIVALEHSDKKAVSWVMKWMIAGGVDKTAAITTTAVVSEIDVVLGRLQVVDYLTIGGLYETLIEKLHKLLRYYPITVEQIRWTYGHTPYTGAASIRTALAAGIVQGIIDGVSDPSLVLSLAKKSRIFTTDLVRAIPGKELSARVHKFQLRAPFTIAQLRFFYAFSGEGHQPTRVP
ncbi:hypothetical protein MMC06_002227 [Schaereria dolodes]|nr:hypothetical protein [Schaereria dolodes]